MDKQKILRHIQNDLKTAKTAKNKVEQSISRWKRTYEGKPYGNEQRHRSSIVVKDVQKHIETMRPSIVQPFLSSDTLIKAKPTNSRSITSASYSQHILNYQFNDDFDKISFIDTISSVLPKEGTVFVRTGWERIEDVKTKRLVNMSLEQIQAAKQIADVTNIEQNKDKTYNATLVAKRLVKNAPTAIVCRNEDIFTDPTANGDLEKAKFIMHEYTASYSDIVKDEIMYPERDAVKKVLSHISNNDPDSVLSSERYQDTMELGTDASFVFSSDSLKKVKLIEYWGEADISGTGKAEQIVCVFVKGTNIVLRLEENPYPDNEIPFVSTPYSREAFTMWGKSLAEPLEDNQRIHTAIMRGFIDNFALSNNGQKFFQKGAIDYGNMKKLASGYRFIEVNNIKGMVDGSYNEMPQSAYNLYNMVESDSESLSGVNKNMDGLDMATVGRTAGGTHAVMSAGQRRAHMTVLNIANMLRKMFKKWDAYNAEFLDDDSIFEINGEFLQVSREQLKGQHKFELRIGMDAQNQGKMQQINMLMQQLNNDGEQVVDKEIKKELVAEFFDAMGKNEMAERIRRTQEPPPSPQQQHMLQLEMKLKAMEAALEEAKVYQTQADAGLKTAQTKEVLSNVGGSEMDAEKRANEIIQSNQLHEQKLIHNEQTHGQKMRQMMDAHRTKMLTTTKKP